MAIKKAKQEEKTRVLLRTPIGMFSYPYLAKKDEGRPESDGKFKVDLLVPLKDWNSSPEAKALREGVLAVGRKFFEDDALSLEDFKNPFSLTDDIPGADERIKGCMRIRAKTTFIPTIYGPDGKEKMTVEDIMKIKGGDYGRMVVDVYPYSQQGGGVTLGLQVVQFARPGKPLGQGQAAALALLDEIEVPVADVPEVSASGARSTDKAFNFGK